jgi:hypothetical protein
LLNTLIETTGGKIQPDIIPHTDPSSISFKHTFVEADNIDEAYTLGGIRLSPPQKGAVINDYVVKI